MKEKEGVNNDLIVDSLLRRVGRLVNGLAVIAAQDVDRARIDDRPSRPLRVLVVRTPLDPLTTIGNGRFLV